MLDWHDADETPTKKQQPKQKTTQQKIRPPTPEQKKEVQPQIQQQTQQDDNWGFDDDNDNWADFSSLDIQDTETQATAPQPEQKKSQPIIRPPTPEHERQQTQKQQSTLVETLPKVKSLDQFLGEPDISFTKQDVKKDTKITSNTDLFSQLEWHDSKPKQSPGDLPHEIQRPRRKLSIHKRSLSTSDTEQFSTQSPSLIQELFAPKEKPSMQQAQFTKSNCKDDEECCVVC